MITIVKFNGFGNIGLESLGLINLVILDGNVYG